MKTLIKPQEAMRTLQAIASELKTDKPGMSEERSQEIDQLIKGLRIVWANYKNGKKKDCYRCMEALQDVSRWMREAKEPFLEEEEKEGFKKMLENLDLMFIDFFPEEESTPPPPELFY